jgi:PAS domain S-box-containing protein
MNKKDPDKRVESKNSLESLQTGFWEWVPGIDQLIPDEAWYKLFGDIAGIRIQSMQEKLELVHRFDRKKVQDLIGKILSGAVWEFRVEYRLKDQEGKFFEIAEFVHIAERSATGAPTRIIGLTRRKDVYGRQPGLQEPRKSFILSDIVKTIKIPSLLVNADSGKFEFWNDAALALFKLSRARMASANLFTLSAESIKLKNSLTGNVSLIPLHYMRNGEGLLLPVEIIFTTYKLEERDYFFCILRDLTQQKQAEKKLRESEQSLRNTISSLGDLILIADQNGNITEHFETGCTLSDAYKDLLRRGNPFPGKSQKIFLKAIDRLMETKEVQQFEVRAKKNGNWWFDIRMSLRKDEFNQITGTTVVVRDISREKETRNLFSEQGERFGQFAELMPLSMAEFDSRGQILFLNTQALRLFGIPKHSLRGTQRNLSEFLSTEDYQKFLSLGSHLLQGSKQRALEFFIIRPDGARTRIICQFDVQLQGNQLLGYRAVLIDQSLHHSMEESLVASKDLAERNFSNRMTRISKLQGEISVCMEELAGQSIAEPKNEGVEAWKKEVMDLGIFARDMNLISWMGVDSDRMKREEVSSGGIIEWIRTGEGRDWSELKKNRVDVEILISSTQEFTLITDKVLFFRLLEHMLNYLTESDRGNDRTLRMNFSDGQVQFLIGNEKVSAGKKNTLVGFIKTKADKTAGVEITGVEALRTSIMQILAEILGGSLKNDGSFLSLKLPAQLSVPAGRSTKVNQQVLTGKKILVVDEDRSFSEQLKGRLSESGVRLWEVQTGRQCLFYCLHQELPDLVLIDPRLPDLPGIEVLNTLRKNDIMIPVIAHTAFATSEDRKKYMAAGFSDCLPKPFNTEVLIQTLLNALAG